MSATVHAHNELPNGTPALGSILVTVNTAGQVIRDPGGNVVFQGPAKIGLVDGDATFTLPGSDDDSLQPFGFTFTAVEQLKHVSAGDYRTVEFQTVNGQTHHLADFASTDEVAEDPTYGANLNNLTGRVIAVEEALDELGEDTGIDPVEFPPVVARFDLITEDSVNPTSTTVYLNCMVNLSGVPGAPDVFAKGRARVRGNSTSGPDKKPYKIKLDDKHSLAGLPESKDWALLADVFDPSHINTATAFSVASLATGLPWTPHFCFVEVYLNGEYHGLYNLVESVEFATGRVEETKATGTTGLALTGAYNLEADTREYQITTTIGGVKINMDDPDDTVPAQKTYIQGHLNAFEEVLYGSGFADPVTGYAAWIDVTSFADWYLIEEFFLNVDSDFWGSCKFTKLRDTAANAAGRGKLRMGPVWDFDSSINHIGIGGNPTTDKTRSPESWYTRPNAAWISRLYDDPTFRTLIGTRWAALKAAMAARGGIRAILTAQSARVANRIPADAELWEYESEWSDHLAAKATFLEARVAFFDAHITDVLAAPTIAPTGVTAVAGPVSATVSFTPPTGGELVTGYRVTASTGETASGTSSPITITGLAEGVSVTFTVKATNLYGQGPASSSSNAVVPEAPPVAGFDVADVADLVLWFDASQISGATADGTHLVTIFDYSGNGHDAISEVAPASEYRKVAAAGPGGSPLPPSGLPVIQSPGAAGTTGLTTSAAVSVFAVVVTSGDSGEGSKLGILCAAATDDYANGLQFGVSNNSTEVIAMLSGGGVGGSDREVTFPDPIPFGEYYLLSSVRDAGTVTDFLNGEQIATASPGGSTTLNNFALTRFYGGSPHYGNRLAFGAVGEIILVNRAVDPTERAEIEDYLTEKWLTA